MDRERRAQQRRLDATQSFNERMRDLYADQVDIAREGAEGVSKTFQITGEALSKHAEAWAAGRETIGEALQGMLSDVLTSIGKESFVKAAFFFAEGLGNLVAFNFPGAATAFAASAAYGVVGGLDARARHRVVAHLRQTLLLGGLHRIKAGVGRDPQPFVGAWRISRLGGHRGG